VAGKEIEFEAALEKAESLSDRLRDPLLSI
jgi:hypothetical protein